MVCLEHGGFRGDPNYRSKQQNRQYEVEDTVTVGTMNHRIRLYSLVESETYLAF